jgi:hypothetical protein
MHIYSINAKPSMFKGCRGDKDRIESLRWLLFAESRRNMSYGNERLKDREM